MDDDQWLNKFHLKFLLLLPNQNNASNDKQFSLIPIKTMHVSSLPLSLVFYIFSKTFDQYVLAEDSTLVVTVLDSSWSMVIIFESNSVFLGTR